MKATNPYPDNEDPLEIKQQPSPDQKSSSSGWNDSTAVEYLPSMLSTHNGPFYFSFLNIQTKSSLFSFLKILQYFRNVGLWGIYSMYRRLAPGFVRRNLPDHAQAI